MEKHRKKLNPNDPIFLKKEVKEYINRHPEIKISDISYEDMNDIWDIICMESVFNEKNKIKKFIKIKLWNNGIGPDDYSNYIFLIVYISSIFFSFSFGYFIISFVLTGLGGVFLFFTIKEEMKERIKEELKEKFEEEKEELKEKFEEEKEELKEKFEEEKINKNCN